VAQVTTAGELDTEAEELEDIEHLTDQEISLEEILQLKTDLPCLREFCIQLPLVVVEMDQDIISCMALQETEAAELLFFVQIHRLRQQLAHQHIAILLQEYIFINLRREQEALLSNNFNAIINYKQLGDM
jgi:hypothetical protein